MATETGVSLQADQLATVPGGPVRFVTMQVPINGVLTTVQAQVVAMTDANGQVLDWSYQPSSNQLADVINELRELRTLIATWMGVPVVNVPIVGEMQPNVFPGGVGAA